ncbi:MAG: hypothetical protein ACQEXJ_13465 [Myxococcota bacterium]
MDTTLILLCILAFAFAITHLEERALGERVRTFSNSEYLILGFVFGPVVLGVLSAERMDELSPLLSVINGFLGFAVGLPLRVRGRDKGPKPRHLGFAILVGVLAAAAVMLAAWGALLLYPGNGEIRGPLLLVAAATLGSGAVAFSAQIIRRAIVRTRADGPISHLLPHVATSGRVIAIVGFGIAIASQRAFVEEDMVVAPGLDVIGLSVAVWNAIAIAAGVASGVIFHIFVGDDADRERLFVATIGLVMLTSGIAHALHFSPLGLGLLAGFTVANVSPCAPRVQGAATRLRRPASVTLLILAGALWTPIAPWMWLLPAGFVGLRVLILWATANVALWRHPSLSGQHRGVGLGLLGQGALTAGIAVNYAMIESTALSGPVVTALLVSAVANDLWAGAGVRSLLRNVGETGRRLHHKEARVEAQAAEPAGQGAAR